MKPLAECTYAELETRRKAREAEYAHLHRTGGAREKIREVTEELTAIARAQDRLFRAARLSGAPL